VTADWTLLGMCRLGGIVLQKLLKVAVIMQVRSGRLRGGEEEGLSGTRIGDTSRRNKKEDGGGTSGYRTKISISYRNIYQWITLRNASTSYRGGRKEGGEGKRTAP